MVMITIANNCFVLNKDRLAHTQSASVPAVLGTKPAEGSGCFVRKHGRERAQYMWCGATDILRNSAVVLKVGLRPPCRVEHQNGVRCGTSGLHLALGGEDDTSFPLHIVFRPDPFDPQSRGGDQICAKSLGCPPGNRSNVCWWNRVAQHV